MVDRDGGESILILLFSTNFGANILLVDRDGGESIPILLFRTNFGAGILRFGTGFEEMVFLGSVQVLELVFIDLVQVLEMVFLDSVEILEMVFLDLVQILELVFLDLVQVLEMVFLDSVEIFELVFFSIPQSPMFPHFAAMRSLQSSHVLHMLRTGIIFVKKNSTIYFANYFFQNRNRATDFLSLKGQSHGIEMIDE